MKPAEYASMDALALADLVRGGQVAPEALAATALVAAEALDPQLNAIVERWPEDVPELVRALPAAGPFRGVPLFLKEAIQVRGKRSQMGSRLAEGTVGSTDSPHMQRLRAAGFVPLGKTAMPEFGYSFTTEPVLYGPTRNPWSLAHSTGGSSGGAAAVVAAGVVPVAQASDGGGSIRVPASYCGLVGLKVSRGRVPAGPQGRESNLGFSVEGCLSRTLRDSAAYLDAVQGAWPGQPYPLASPERPYAEALRRPFRPLRIAVLADSWGGSRTEPVVRDALEKVAATCAALGHRVEPAAVELGASWDEFVLTLTRSGGSNMARVLPALSKATGRPVDETTVEQPARRLAEFGATLKATELAEAMDVRHRVTRNFHLLFEQVDVLLSPTMPRLPLALGVYADGLESLDVHGWAHRIFGHSPFTPLYSMTGLPALSLPLGHDAPSDLPIGMQFGAGFAREDVLFEIGAQLEQTMPWRDRRPRVWAGNA